MTAATSIIDVYLVSENGAPRHVGLLSREKSRAVRFHVDADYLQAGPGRPMLSLSWFDPESEERTGARLNTAEDKMATNGFLPPWFANLLPEGALRLLVEKEMGPGDHQDFDLLGRLGADLPGAVVAVPRDRDFAVHAWRDLGGFRAPIPKGSVKFSLAGVQLKFAGGLEGRRVTVPGRTGARSIILKVPSEHHARLPEVEYSAMRLAAGLGVHTAEVELVACSDVRGIPQEALAHGETCLAVARFDRLAGRGRRHMEDMAQVIGAVGDRKYTMGNLESVLNIVRRFSAQRDADLLEGFRRILVDILLGNGDNHLKNWSFVFEDGRHPRLSPAYDIVPTWIYDRDPTLALKFVGTSTAAAVNRKRVQRAAGFLGMDVAAVERELRRMTELALDVWPKEMADLPLPEEHALALLGRLRTLTMVREYVPFIHRLG